MQSRRSGSFHGIAVRTQKVNPVASNRTSQNCASRRCHCEQINNSINITNANKVDDQFLLDVSITQFNNKFEILGIIQSNKVDISSNKWKLFNPTILKDDQKEVLRV